MQNKYDFEISVDAPISDVFRSLIKYRLNFDDVRQHRVDPDRFSITMSGDNTDILKFVRDYKAIYGRKQF